MAVDLGTIPTNADLTVLDTIPLNTDYTPYQDLQAQGRYGQLLMPDNLPALLSMLYGPRSDGNPNGQLCSFDGKHNLNVNVAAGSAGGGPSPVAMASPESVETNIVAGYHQYQIYNTNLTVAYGFRYYIFPDALHPWSGTGSILMGLDDGSRLQVILAVAMFDANATAAHPCPTVPSGVVMFPWPIDLVKTRASLGVNGIGYDAEPSGPWISMSLIGNP